MYKDLLNREKALIFRIVHRDNVAAVLADGCQCRSSAKCGPGYVEIGNPELIAKRMSREVPCGPGGTLSDYVPFYFTPFSPMLYNIKTGFNGITKRPMGANRPIGFLAAQAEGAGPILRFLRPARLPKDSALL